MTRRAGVLPAILVFFSACGIFGPRGPLAETTDRLGDIRSGNLSFKLSAATKGGAQSGFELEGPFSIPSGASLPTASMDFRRLGVAGSEASTFISTEKAAYVKAGGRTYQLPPERVSGLKGSREPEGGPFEGLNLSDWVRDPRVTRGPDLGGVQTEVIKGELQVATALNDLFELARDMGNSDLPSLDRTDKEHLEGAVRSARIEVITGREDRLLRKLSMVVDLGAEGPERVPPELRDLLGVNFRLDMAIGDPNKRVRVTAPENAVPLSRLDSRPG